MYYNVIKLGVSYIRLVLWKVDKPRSAYANAIAPTILEGHDNVIDLVYSPIM